MTDDDDTNTDITEASLHKQQTEIMQNEVKLLNLFQLLTFPHVMCTRLWVVLWMHCQPVYIYLLHFNSILLTDCIMVIVKIVQKSYRCF